MLLRKNDEQKMSLLLAEVPQSSSSLNMQNIKDVLIVGQKKCTCGCNDLQWLACSVPLLTALHFACHRTHLKLLKGHRQRRI
jgi:hypothetical protein